jgi:hypothetical protein
MPEPSTTPASELIHQQVQGVRSALDHLLPGCNISVEVLERNAFLQRHTPEAFHERSGQVLDEQEALLWVKLPGDCFGLFTVSRARTPFSEAEHDLLATFTETIRDVQFVTSEWEIQQAELVSNSHAFERLLTAHLLRGDHPESVGFWTPNLIIGQLQDLAIRRYEGQPTTSGFIVVSHPEAYLERQVAPSPYTFAPFPEHIPLHENFFEKAASHRYIDGRNAFYLIDWRLDVRGVLRNTEPTRYDKVGRAANEHLEPLLQADASEVWAGYVGNNDDVNVAVTRRKHLRWLTSHWHFVDQHHLTNALHQQGLASGEIDELVAIMLAVSDLRRGTLILIPDDEEHLPERAGHIDDSPLGESLYESLVGRKMSGLRRERSAIGMLTSDGMTTIARSGRIMGCGKIVRVERMSEHQQRAGGGRTQAAIAASRYGLVIKISEDGLISFFKDGREQIRIVF